MTTLDQSFSQSNTETETDGSLLWTASYQWLNGAKFLPVTVKLTTAALHFNIQNGTEIFELDEIASCALVSHEEITSPRSKSICLRTRVPQPAENDAYLRFVLYPNRPRSSRHRRRVIVLLINVHTAYDDNLNEANLFHSKISSLLHSGHVNAKPLLIILNPKSGRGKALQIFNDRVKPLLDDCVIKYNVLTTKHAGHATEFFETNVQDLQSSYSAVVVVSGDGLLFEVLNGFVKSIELSNEAQIPMLLGIIPGGSGNGLANSINHIFLNCNKGTNGVLQDCAFHVIKGQPKKMDLVRITTAQQKVYYSFLSFGWGILADIDIESERLRCIGEPRFAVWSVYRAFALRKYSGTLSYLPAENTEKSIPPIDCPINENWVTESGKFVLVYAAYQKYISSTVKFAPEAELDDQTIYLIYIKDNVSSLQMIRFLLALEQGTHIKLPFANYVAVRSFRLSPDNLSHFMVVDGEKIDSSSTVQAEVMPAKASILVRN